MIKNRETRLEFAAGLRLTAERYFNDNKSFHTGSGICAALDEVLDLPWEDNSAYYWMDDVMDELNVLESYFGPCTHTPEGWEPRAYMCLFLAEYLEASV